MPLTADEYVLADPWCAKIRAEVEGLRARAASRPRSIGGSESIAARATERLAVEEAEARRMWDLGLAGWLTLEEAAQVAAELTADAAAQGINATATVVESDRYKLLVFSGSRYGRHQLSICTTSPVRARKHWAGYLEACPRRQQELL